MFTVHFHLGTRSEALRRPSHAGGSRTLASPAPAILRLAALSGVLALVGPRTVSAQALGTMQVTARVIPASVAWAGVAAADAVVQAGARVTPGGAAVSRTGLVYARAEQPLSGRGSLLVVTIQHPYN